MRLIDADRALKIVWDQGRAHPNAYHLTNYAALILQEAPTIEADPVRHGEWVLGDVEPGYFTPGGNRPWICSECGQVVSWMLGKPNEKYCPNCGAKMDKEE